MSLILLDDHNRDNTMSTAAKQSGNDARQQHRMKRMGLPPDDGRKLRKFFSSGSHMYVIYVNDDTCFDVYHNEVLRIKKTIADLNGSHQGGALTDTEYCASVKMNWLDGVVATFLEKYGVAMTPIDIRNAIDDVRVNLNEEMMVWPEVEYDVVDTSNVDHIHVISHHF